MSARKDRRSKSTSQSGRRVGDNLLARAIETALRAERAAQANSEALTVQAEALKLQGESIQAGTKAMKEHLADCSSQRGENTLVLMGIKKQLDEQDLVLQAQSADLKIVRETKLVLNVGRKGLVMAGGMATAGVAIIELIRNWPH